MNEFLVKQELSSKKGFPQQTNGSDVKISRLF